MILKCLSASHLTSVKFHKNISNGFQSLERTQFCDRQMVRQTDIYGKNNTSLILKGGDIIQSIHAQKGIEDNNDENKKNIAYLCMDEQTLEEVEYKHIQTDLNATKKDILDMVLTL